MGALGEAIAPYYIYLKFVHLAAVMAWAFSTSHAFLYYLVPVFRRWRKNPQDENVVTMRNWVMERFDEGAVIEHTAFPIILITGLLMLSAGIWSAESGWLVLKLAIVIAIMIPIEVADYYLSHFGGNKARIRRQGRFDRYESMIRAHWLFFLITTPLITVFLSAIVFLAVVKPF